MNKKILKRTRATPNEIIGRFTNECDAKEARREAELKYFKNYAYKSYEPK